MRAIVSANSFHHRRSFLAALLAILFHLAIPSIPVAQPSPTTGGEVNEANSRAVTEEAILGGGCFWCIEAVFNAIDGVISVESGYAGGKTEHPTYEEVSRGQSGHAEVVRVQFDPRKISFDEILNIFFHAHDPTTLNRQGADVGTEYRSVIFAQTELQRKTAEAAKERIAKSGLWPAPLVTEIGGPVPFYRAEEHHQDYYRQNPQQPYCSIVIAPKLQKIYREFNSRLKRNIIK